MKGLGYVRVSRIGAREHLISPAEQLRSIEAVAAREGITIIDVLEELDVSGADDTRPKWNEALDRIVKGEAQALVVWNISRFSRSTVDALKALERIEKAGGSLFSASGDVGDNTPTGKLTRTIFLGLAQMERERARDGFAAAQQQAIDKGIFISWRVPTGYTRDPSTRKLVPNEMAPVVQGLFERRAKGWSWSRLARWFIENGGSQKTSRQTMMNMIQNTSYLGWSRHGQKVNKRAHPALVSQRLFHVAAEKRPYHLPTGIASATALFGGLVRCDGCDKPLTVTTNGRAQVSYACKTLLCDARAGARVAAFDAEVVSRIFSYMNRFSAAEYVTKFEDNASDLAAAQKALSEAQYDRALFIRNKELRRLLTDAEYNQELQSLTDAVTETEIAVSMLEPSIELEQREPLSDIWDSWTNESRREWLREIIRDLILRTANKRAVPVSTRMALRLNGTVAASRWLLSDGLYKREPFDG